MSFMLNVIYDECHLCLVSFMLSVIYAECHYAECHYAQCCYAECRGAIFLTNLIIIKMYSIALKLCLHWQIVSTKNGSKSDWSLSWFCSYIGSLRIGIINRNIPACCYIDQTPKRSTTSSSFLFFFFDLREKNLNVALL